MISTKRFRNSIAKRKKRPNPMSKTLTLRPKKQLRLRLRQRYKSRAEEQLSLMRILSRTRETSISRAWNMRKPLNSTPFASKN